MRRFLQWLLRRPVIWAANRFSSSPKRALVFASLNQLLSDIRAGKTASGQKIPFALNEGRFVIVSDQHKGARDFADDFRLAEANYMKALGHYYDGGFTLINIGDAEELWENKPAAVIEKNRQVLLEEARFLEANRYYRIFGNHDLEWKFDFPRNLYLKPLFGKKLKIPEGILLETRYNDQSFSVFLTHGHQGDKKSDGNPISTWIVAAIWTPIQRYLEVSINVTADSFELVDTHNIMMYEWSATQKNLIFISGHTHKPVFASLDHIDRLNKQLEKAEAAGDTAQLTAIREELERRQAEYAGKQFHKTMAIPSYFNTGCCCFSDGDMTAIEIEGDAIRLVKWKQEAGLTKRVVLEASSLSYLFDVIAAAADTPAI